MSQAKGLDPRFQILPLPQNIEILKGQGIAGSELGYIVSKGESKIPVLGTLLDALPRIEKQGAGITLSLSEQNTPESPEGYTLEITSRGVTIQSRGQAGLFYGCQTLEQLMEDSRDLRIPIPCLRMTDYPEISYRAVHFDTKHHLDRAEYYYRTIDKLARYKVNAIIGKWKTSCAIPAVPKWAPPMPSANKRCRLSVAMPKNVILKSVP